MPSVPRSASVPLAPEPTWYKDAVVYELHVRSFSDSTRDGTGDFIGLTHKLDYLQDLGVTALWLLPFYPSPLRDDGYDIADYTNVHPMYGTLRDFRLFLREAHSRGLRVITELVLNHTSDQHPWFQRARRAPPGSSERNFYVWSDSPEKFAGVRIIFKDFEASNWSWDPVAKAYYYHRFYGHQPDLNYDNPAVVRAIFKVIDFWLGLGVDGLRLDAVPYLFKREATSCENLPETHVFLKKLRRHIDERFSARMLLAEANQWPEDAALYFGSGRGDECHSAFHFPLMPRLFMATRMETRFPIVEILQQTPAIPVDSQWFIFLRNHDELTLEMVSDEERDYMYRVYATDPHMRLNLGIRRRLAPLLSNDRRLLDLMNGLLFSLPGTPVLYYGDEIGMGDNVYLGDRNGVRTPMQWSSDRNAGFSQGNPQSLHLPVIIDPEYHYEAINVEAQLANPHSLLWHMKRLLALRKQTRVFGRGALTFLFPENPRVLAFLRSEGDDRVLVVANLSHLVQAVDLDLKAFRGYRPVELFGQNEFPEIGEAPYRFTLGPYDFFWFRLRAPPTALAPEAPAPYIVPTLPFEGTWRTLEQHAPIEALESVLLGYLRGRRWFRGKARTPVAAHWQVAMPLARGDTAPRLAFVQVDFAESDPQEYILPLLFADSPQVQAIQQRSPAAIVAQFEASTLEPERTLYDAAQDPAFVYLLLDRITKSRPFRVDELELSATRTEALTPDVAAEWVTLPLTPLKGEQSNSSVRIGDRLILKVFRTLGGGPNPELEIGRFLLRTPGSALVAPLCGYVEFQVGSDPAETVAVLHRFVANEGDAWGLTLEALRGYFERVRAHAASGKPLPTATSFPSDLGEAGLPPEAAALVGPYLELARLLGTRTAQLHVALSGNPADPEFAPEKMTSFYIRSIYQTMQTSRSLTFELLRSRLSSLPAELRPLAQQVLGSESAIDQRYRRLLGRSYSAQRIRIHGDYHLGQVLWTGKDFVVIDFEGEPLRSISDRRIKRSPLRDVAGMLRSFGYAAHAARRQYAAVDPAGSTGDLLATASQLWLTWVSRAFLEAYRQGTESVDIVPRDPAEFQLLIDAYIVEKAVYELSYELDNRPDWVEIPLRGLQYLLGIGG
jgi:maltose alpha-D-glucosyltransferase/alpha-amylase